MAKKKNYYYVLVLTGGGPTFVTKVNYLDKTAEWDKLGTPLEMSKDTATDLAMGLNLNMHASYVVCSPFEIDTQPYRYENGEFEWKWNEEEN